MIGGDMSQLQSVFSRAKNEARTTGQEIGHGLSEGIRGGLEAFAGMEGIKKAFEYVKEESERAHKIELGAERLGITIERFQDLEKAARDTGISVDAFYTAFKKIAVSSVEAENGSAEMIASFANLGVTIEDLKSKAPDQIFAKIAANMQGIEPSMAQISGMVKTLGRSATELIPGFKSGAFGNMNLFTMTGDEVEEGAKFKKQLNLLGDAWDQLVRKILSPEANRGGIIARGLKGLSEMIQFDRGFGNIGKLLTYQAPSSAESERLKAISKAEIEAGRAKEKKAEHDKEEAAKRLAKLHSELRSEQERTDLAELKNEEKLHELLKRRGVLLEIINGAKNPEEAVKAAIEIEKIDQERNHIKQQMEKVTRRPVDVNSLQKIGGMYSSVDLTMLDVSKKSEQHLREIKTTLQKSGGGGARF